jgi:hypothetical protein
MHIVMECISQGIKYCENSNTIPKFLLRIPAAMHNSGVVLKYGDELKITLVTV